MFDKAKCAKHVTTMSLNKIFVQSRSETKAFQQKLLFSVFENKEKMVLVMEIAAGGELYDYLSERKTLEEKEARRVFRQIATAVFYCHKVRLFFFKSFLGTSEI